MATTSGKSKASCLAANAAPPSASTRQQPWRRCRRTAHPRNSNSPAHHLTPALPTVPPVPPKSPPNTKLRYMYTWLTDTRGCSSPSSLNFELLSVNLYYISTSDYNHGPLTFVRTHKTHRNRCTIKSWISRCSFIPPCVTWTAGAARAHTSQGQYEQSLHFIDKFSGKENCAFCLFFFND